MNIIRRPFRYSYSNATLIIILVNIGVFLATTFMPGLSSVLGLSLFGTIERHYWWQPFTYMFVHGSFFHIFFNMMGLFFFGIPTEKTIGTKEFLLMYLLCGTLIGLLSMGIFTLAVSLTKNIVYAYVTLVGASGSIYSLLMVYAVLFPKSKIYVWGILPVQAPLLIVIYFVIEFGSQFTSRSGVAHYAHLLGLVLAWLYMLVRMGVNPIKVWKEAYRR